MLRIGHRGAAAHEPENTLRSFWKAIELGADMIEFDVRVCGTGEVVVIHDETVDRTTDGSGKVSDLGLDELRRLNAGSGERIPLLSEVVEGFRGKVGLNIEIKGQGTALPVAELLERCIKEHSIKEEGIITSSFLPGELLDLKKALGDASVGFLFEDHPMMGLEFAGELGARYVLPRYDLLNAELMENARSRRQKVIVWTVNEEASILRMRNLGVDGIITDRPELLRL
ncbi:MAG: glycerophosphodiester phosphodiesterase [Candidatus Thermoplasmatota archaeon]|nr:glycerophosphodiester phosphodiesterase [Candidatus Thermoplasmatota archaeon]